jgi:hypothetical protein
MRPKSTLDVGSPDFRMRLKKLKSTLCRAERTLRCDLKTEVNFRMPRGADFELRLKKSTLDCRIKRTLDATAVVDFVPRGVDLRCKERKALSRKQKQKNKRKQVVLPSERA